MATTCPPAVNGDLSAATVADFALAFGEVETVELSNIDSPGASYNCDRLNQALQDAYRYLKSIESVCSSAGGVVIRSNLRRWMLIIARYYLDSLRKREDVKADFTAIDKQLQEFLAESGNIDDHAYSEDARDRAFSDEFLVRSTSTYNG